VLVLPVGRGVVYCWCTTINSIPLPHINQSFDAAVARELHSSALSPGAILNPDFFIEQLLLFIKRAKRTKTLRYLFIWLFDKLEAFVLLLVVNFRRIAKKPRAK
jgi:hypothetical protein